MVINETTDGQRKKKLKPNKHWRNIGGIYFFLHLAETKKRGKHKTKNLFFFCKEIKKKWGKIKQITKKEGKT